MTELDLLYSEVEEDLASAVRAVLADRCPPQAVLARCEGPEPYDAGLWRVLAREVGVAALAVPEALGGAGASWREAAVVMEEAGRACAPVPFLGSAVLATSVLLDARDRGADELAALAAGERSATLAVPLSTAPDAPFPSGVRATGEGELTGSVRSVADALTADLLIVPADGPDGPGLYAVEAAAATVAARGSLDLTRPLADLELTGAPGRLLIGPDQADAVLFDALLTGAGLLASEQLGVAEWCLTTTVAYLRERRQFGRVVGSFQALKHRLADLWLDVAGARAAARAAADALAAGSADAAVLVAVAASHCGSVAVRAAEEAVQLHGGIGMTWEHPVHLYLKRAKADQLALGTPGRHRATLATLAALPAPGGAGRLPRVPHT
ncbi:acyl-CoA dehydrogenase family protein [Kitasatospora sp. NPDC057015]|uniref:acyl-CoA dehydrogenase family protein n=1 Tax=Kitasatospora sp. NPDC057015 TaxID=3346001 RepID=UPI00362B2DFA